MHSSGLVHACVAGGGRIITFSFDFHLCLPLYPSLLLSSFTPHIIKGAAVLVFRFIVCVSVCWGG